jgi:hypothetical protein
LTAQESCLCNRLAWAVSRVCKKRQSVVILWSLTTLIGTFVWVRCRGIDIASAAPRLGGGGGWRGTYRMLKFVVDSLELDSLLTEGSIVDPRCAILE